MGSDKNRQKRNTIIFTRDLSQIRSVFRYKMQNVLRGPDHIDNTAYLIGGLGDSQTEIAMVFNRLVDPAAIRQVTVNGISYTAE